MYKCALTRPFDVNSIKWPSQWTWTSLGTEIHRYQNLSKVKFSCKLLCVGSDVWCCLDNNKGCGLAHNWVEGRGKQMQNSIVTLIMHRAGSSAECNCYGFTAGKETESGLFAYEGINTKKWLKENGQGQRGEGTRVRWRDLVAWESHLRDGSEWMGRDGRGGGDA